MSYECYLHLPYLVIKWNSSIRGRMCVETEKCVSDAHMFEGRTFDWLAAYYELGRTLYWQWVYILNKNPSV